MKQDGAAIGTDDIANEATVDQLGAGGISQAIQTGDNTAAVTQSVGSVGMNSEFS